MNSKGIEFEPIRNPTSSKPIEIDRFEDLLCYSEKQLSTDHSPRCSVLDVAPGMTTRKQNNSARMAYKLFLLNHAERIINVHTIAQPVFSQPIVHTLFERTTLLLNIPFALIATLAQPGKLL